MEAAYYFAQDEHTVAITGLVVQPGAQGVLGLEVEGDDPLPAALAGITPLGFMVYPTYRLALLGIITVALLALYFVLYRTRIGMIVRAGIEDAVMVDSLGINIQKGLGWLRRKGSLTKRHGNGRRGRNGCKCLLPITSAASAMRC
ncbi:MAG: hypothetical protein DYG89_54910 [Caldilinea sp. CFX5]|nr:hypothetical protein [Caldilinea sp. CFX5]